MEMYANTERLVLYQNIARMYFIVVTVLKGEFWVLEGFQRSILL